MNIKIKLNTALRGNVEGSIVRIKVTVNSDGSYIPKDIYWRRRLKDAKIDNCIEIVYPDEPEVILIKEVFDKSVVKRKYTRKKKDTYFGDEVEVNE